MRFPPLCFHAIFLFTMDRHLTVATFVVCQNKTLLHWHHKHHMWLPVGGHVDPNESPCEAAIRETKEEAGLAIELYHPLPFPAQEDTTIRKLTAPVYIQNESLGPDHEHIDCIFYGRAKTLEIQPEEGSVQQLGWYNEKELETLPLAQDVKAFALEALRLLGEPALKF